MEWSCLRKPLHDQEVFTAHANAALTPRARLRLAQLIVEQGWTIAQAADRYDVSWPTAKRWSDRYRSAGAAVMTAMMDRSSRPHRQPHRTPPQVVRRIVQLRLKQRLGPVEIGDRLGQAASTVHAVLTRCRLNRLSHIDRITGDLIRQVRRYEHPHPGALLHVDVKKLGNIPDGGGWRYVGRQQGEKNRSATATASQTRNRHYGPRIGTAFVHTVLDDHSRVAYAEIHDNETAQTATAVLRRATAWFADRGVTVERVLSDNGSAYRSHLWRDTCLDLGITPKRTQPYRPQTNGKIERFHRTPRRRLGLRPPLPHRASPPRRPTSMAPSLQSPPAPHRHRQATTINRLTNLAGQYS